LPPLAFAWHVPLAPLFPGEELIKRTEALLPQRAPFRDPPRSVVERIRLEATPALAAAFFTRNEARLLEHGEMLVHRRQRHLERLRKLPERGIAER
jgi:hypothetical protein